jgi:hypothetical protein
VSLASWFRGAVVSDAEVRSEIWKLGSRHLGRPLEGAMEELNSADVTPGRASLLRSCIRKLRSA